MANQINRRSFIGDSLRISGGLAAAIYGGGPLAASTSPNEKLNLAAIGVANKGRHNIDQLLEHNIVALCDVDENFLNEAAKTFPSASKYRDYRVLLDKEANRIDAVVISTADHTHAPATSAALQLGKHAYCEKPLTHTVSEARAIATLAARHKVATQMGIQIHAEDNYRRVVEWVRSGAIGEIEAVYNWCNKGWSDGRFNDQSGPCPADLDWDLWLGPAAERAYSDNLHPSNWRRFWEYGSGTLGDMACHVMDLPFWALDLKSPARVSCEGPPVHPIGAPAWCRASYEFPRDGKPPLQFYWADGGENFDFVKHAKDADGKPLSDWGLGILFVGKNGMLAADYGRRQLLPADQFKDFKPPEPSIAPSIGHWKEWTEACKTGAATSCNFGYAGRLTETVLLGIVAFRSGTTVDWRGEELVAHGNPAAQQFVSKKYRRGFEVVGLSGQGN
jgi:predicted dehydrogenase